MEIVELNPEANTEVTVALQILSPKKAKSRYWKYFGFWADENGTILDKEKVVCKLCHKTQKHLSNTTNLRVHLKAHHKVELAAIEADIQEQNAAASTQAGQPAETAVTSIQSSRDSPHKGATIVSLEPVKYLAYVHPQGGSHQNIQQILAADQSTVEVSQNEPGQRDLTALCTFLCKDLYPVSLLEGEGFQNLIQTLKPGFTLPSLNIVKEEIRKLYDSYRSEFLESLRKLDSISLSMEVWSLNSADCFATLTVHYISPNWKREGRILQTRKCRPGQNANYLSTQIYPCIEELQFDRRNVIAITVDGAVINHMKAVDESAMVTIQCFARLINQSICQAFSCSQVLSHILIKVRSIIEHIVNFAKDNTISLEKKELFGHMHSKLTGDNPGNWKSSYEMLAHVLQQRSAIMSFLLDRKLDQLELSTIEWCVIQQVINILKTAKATTEALLSQKYPHASMILPLFRLLVDSVSEEKDGELPIVKDFRQTLLNVFKSKYQKAVTRDLLNFASFCDPRFKALTHLTDEERAAVKEKITAKMVKISEDDGGNESDTAPPPSKRQKEDLTAVEYLFSTFFETSVQTPAKKPRNLGRSLIEKCENEIKNYLAEERLLLANDPLDYWKCAEHRYPLLGKLALRYLSVTATCVPSDRVFSQGDTVSKKRCHLETDMVDVLLYTHDHFIQTKSAG